jgi:hypothetical protein
MIQDTLQAVLFAETMLILVAEQTRMNKRKNAKKEKKKQILGTHRRQPCHSIASTGSFYHKGA